MRGKMLKCRHGVYQKIPNGKRRDRCAGLLEEKRGIDKDGPCGFREFRGCAGKVAKKGAKNLG